MSRTRWQTVREITQSPSRVMLYAPRLYCTFEDQFTLLLSLSHIAYTFNLSTLNEYHPCKPVLFCHTPERCKSLDPSEKALVRKIHNSNWSTLTVHPTQIANIITQCQSANMSSLSLFSCFLSSLFLLDGWEWQRPDLCMTIRCWLVTNCFLLPKALLKVQSWKKRRKECPTGAHNLRSETRGHENQYNAIFATH